MNKEKLEELKNYAGPDKVVSSHELQSQMDAKRATFISVKSLIPTLDRYIECFMGGELISISGPTKNGKTLLAQTLTVNFQKQMAPALWFTYEVPARQFLSQFPELPALYMPAKLKAHAIEWLEERILESFAKYRTRIVFIDHLHYLVDMARVKQISIEIGTVIRALKRIAVENDMVLFLLCHTTKGRAELGLSYDNIRDSSFVSQESDTVFMVQRMPRIGDNAARMSVEFHRRTGVMEKTIDLIKEGGLLYEAKPVEKVDDFSGPVPR